MVPPAPPVSMVFSVILPVRRVCVNFNFIRFKKIIMEKMRLSNANFGTIVTDMLQPLDDSEIDRFF